MLVEIYLALPIAKQNELASKHGITRSGENNQSVKEEDLEELRDTLIPPIVIREAYPVRKSPLVGVQEEAIKGKEKSIKKNEVVKKTTKKLGATKPVKGSDRKKSKRKS